MEQGPRYYCPECDGYEDLTGREAVMHDRTHHNGEDTTVPMALRGRDDTYNAGAMNR